MSRRGGICWLGYLFTNYPRWELVKGEEGSKEAGKLAVAGAKLSS